MTGLTVTASVVVSGMLLGVVEDDLVVVNGVVVDWIGNGESEMK